MSIWEDEWEDYEMDKADFECWLDSLEGEGTDEEKYNRFMKEQEDARIDKEWEERQSVEYPEWVISTSKYTMTISNN